MADTNKNLMRSLSKLPLAYPLKTAAGVGALGSGNLSVVEYGDGVIHKTVITLASYSLTLTANGTSTAGGGAKIYDFPEGLILPLGASANLTVANAGGDGSFLASLGSAAAGTDGTLTGTEITFAPSTAATVSSGVGTCKMKSTALAPVAGTPVDGTSTPADLFLNGCLNADGTGKLTLTISGTITILWADLGDVA